MCGFIGVVSKKDINHNQLKLSMKSKPVGDRMK